jgi:hypothetical protein
MQLIEARPIPTPADAERLLADLWQLTSGRALGLFIIGLHGERVALGVHCHNQYVEDTAAATISDHCGGSVEPGWAIGQMIDIADDVAAVNMDPADRHLAVDSSTFGWQRTDPLRGTFHALTHLHPATVAGVGITLRSLPNLECMMSLTAFCAGPDAGLTAMKIASTYAGVGVKLRRPLRQRRAIRRTLNSEIRRPFSRKRIEIVSLFWHPPYGQDAPQMTAAHPA